MSEKKYEIPIGEFVIGRSFEGSAANIQINEVGKERISRIHCRIYNDGSKLEVEDLNSMNGTYINEKEITAGEKFPLKNKDMLGLGSCDLEVRIVEENSDVGVN